MAGTLRPTDAVSQRILVGAGPLFVSVLSTLASARPGLPVLLVLLVVGMLAGEDGPGGTLLGGVLVRVARPLAVTLCLAPLRYPAREVAFIA